MGGLGGAMVTLAGCLIGNVGGLLIMFPIVIILPTSTGYLVSLFLDKSRNQLCGKLDNKYHLWSNGKNIRMNLP
jgi:hypothetical protein